MSGILRSRVVLLAFVVIALVGSAFLLTPKPATAITCPAGSYPGRETIFYTNAKHTKVACAEFCGDTSCDPTPYYININTCCAE